MEFIFNPVTSNDLDKYIKESNVFNVSEEEIKSEKIVLNTFEDEKLGSSTEKLDIAVYNNGVWSWVTTEDKVSGYNEIPLGYLLEGIEYTRVLVLVRRMSTIVLDRVKDGYSCYILCKVPDKYYFVSEDKALFGLLAKNQVYLDVDADNIKSQVQSNIVDRTEEICSKLFEV